MKGRNGVANLRVYKNSISYLFVGNQQESTLDREEDETGGCE